MASSSNVMVKCQICAQNTHEADRCPFLHTKCRKPGCKGIRKLLTSTTEKNKDRKFLKCHLVGCSGFQWLDEAIIESNGYDVPDHNCFYCGSSYHWYQHCKWTISPCKKSGCNGARVLKISGSLLNPGKKFLKCGSCGGFQWLLEAMEKEAMEEDAEQCSVNQKQTIVVNAKIVIDVDVLCGKLANHVVLK